ncbi:exonuclease subunit SbcD [Marinobacterium jannaschii]|uniref:exonuclease subunit SbcD n=1 Tax=Marinobacterium jannaschii TaxID=64970 RepID=UPI000481941E|nr:exonuclease subunit SbcD [Marinobacterium jannaschii]
MRLLHTSDWHLGQNFMGKSRANEHQAFLDWLLVLIESERIDALVIAGDIFDTGTPPSYAREIYNHFVVQIQASGCQLVILGGNHDSVATLHESRTLLACLNVTVIGGAQPEIRDQLVVIHDRSGEPAAVLAAIPYLRPRDLVSSQAGESPEAKQQAMTQAIADHYAALYTEAEALRDSFSSPLPIIATGHLTTVGSTSSESVREIYIGTLEAFPASAFPPVDYLALGHLHKAQKVAGEEHLRYSGSPIPLSFDEIGNDKQVLLAEFSEGALQSVTPVAVPHTQPMARWKGNLQQLEARFQELEPLSLRAKPLWLDIEVQEDDYLSDLHNRLQALAEEHGVEILRLRRQRQRNRQGLEQQSRETLSELNIDEVFERRLSAEALENDPAAAGLRNAFAEIRASLDEELNG